MRVKTNEFELFIFPDKSTDYIFILVQVLDRVNVAKSQD